MGLDIFGLQGICYLLFSVYSFSWASREGTHVIGVWMKVCIREMCMIFISAKNFRGVPLF